MGQLSIALQLPGRRCLVVGGGDVARRKVTTLLRGGAQVTVVAPEVAEEFPSDTALIVHRREFEAADAEACDLVFACTDDRAVNAAVAKAATKGGVWVNVADDPDASTFFVNAAVQRGDLSIGVSTAGASPALARRIRKTLEAQFGEAYAPFVNLLADMRKEVFATESAPEKRRAAFDRMAAVPCERIMADGGVNALAGALRAAAEGGGTDP